jgi:hypothetical protein
LQTNERRNPLSGLKYVEKTPQKLTWAGRKRVGKASYCLKALFDKGWVKASNFKKAKKTILLLYTHTKRDRAESKITVNFFKCTIQYVIKRN